MKILFAFVVISLLTGVLWYGVFWFAYRPIAPLVGFAAFCITILWLYFNYGANCDNSPR